MFGNYIHSEDYNDHNLDIQRRGNPTQINVRIKRLSESAVIPRKAHASDAAYDLFCPKDTTIPVGRSAVPLDIAIELPVGYEASIQPRSGYASKGFEIITPAIYNDEGREVVPEYSTRADIDVILGTVDAGYRQGICVIVNNHEGLRRTIRKGQRIAQMIIRKVEDICFEETDTLSESDRDGGLGHTGSF